MNELPTAVWSGEIMGVKVHVLDDGRRIVDADDLWRLINRVESGDDFDVEAFGKEYAEFMNGATPHKGEVTK